MEVFFLLAEGVQMLSTLTISVFTGTALKTYLPSICRLRIEVFRDYPYLDEGNFEEEMEYFKKYPECPEAIAVLIFDGSKIVGASTGIPLEYENETIQEPFLFHDLDPSDFFFFSESVLLKEYRGRGVGYHFFDLREEHAKKLKRFDYSCFCCVERDEEDPKKPSDYMPLHHFWRKRGYALYPELYLFSSWKDIGDLEESKKKMYFWIKRLY
jgi:GNAT superfamily N-acetyltransferase